MPTSIKLYFAIIDRNTWKCVCHKWYYAASSDTVQTLQRHVATERTSPKGLPMENLHVFLLENPYTGRKTTKNLNSLNWEDIEANSEHPGANDLLCDIVSEKRDALHLMMLCDVKSIGPTPLTSIQEEGPHTSKADKSHDFAESVLYIQRHQKAPSSGAQNSEMLSTQKLHVPNAIYNGRPLWLTGPTLSIFDPIFLKFQTMLAESPSDIPFEELEHAYTIVSESARYFPSERDRQMALEEPFRELLGCIAMPLSFTLGSQQVVPDMHRRVLKCHVPSTGVRFIVSFIGECKNGAGSGNCDPMDQAAKVYESMAVAPQMDELRKVSCLPTFLMTILGPQLSLSGAIFLDGVVVKPLMPPMMLSDPDPIRNVAENPVTTLVTRVAHFLRTLKGCLAELDKAYEALIPANPDQRDSRLRPAPHLVSLESSEGLGRIELTYEDNMRSPRYAHAVFSASAHLVREDKTVRCIVKFTTQYHVEGHKLMGRESIVADLLHCEFEPTVGMLCVITKYIPEADVPISSEGADALRKGLNLLHESSLVFGDLRDANIILNEKGWPHVIDFDWCGTVGQTRYPFDINTGKDPKTQKSLWVDGVKPGGLIEPEHDIQMLSKYLDIFNSK